LRNLNVGWSGPFPVRVEEPKISVAGAAGYGEENGSDFVAAGGEY